MKRSALVAAAILWSVTPSIAQEAIAPPAPSQRSIEGSGATLPPADPAATRTSYVASPPKPMPAALHDLSPWSMFRSADPLVKAVMISLVIASLATWTILLAKTIQLSRGRRQIGEALERISECRSLAEARRSWLVTGPARLARRQYRKWPPQAPPQ